MTDATDRLREVLDLVGRAQELLDQAVGKAARLALQEKELVRLHLLEPRNHLRSSADSLRRKVEDMDEQASAKRRELMGWRELMG